MSKVERHIDAIHEILMVTSHGTACTYRHPGGECDCGKADAMAALSELNDALDTLGILGDLTAGTTVW